jgi:hypothetical protein
MFPPLAAPDPISIDELLLVATIFPAALSVVVDFEIAPLVSNSMFPDEVCRDSLSEMGEVFVEDPIVMALGLVVKEIDDGS